MDAVEFIKAWNRMLKLEGKAPCIEFCTARTPEETVSSVEQWAKEHPVKTRQSVFLEQWPNADFCDDGYLSLAPCSIDTRMAKGGSCGSKCSDCRREFWMQEVE